MACGWWTGRKNKSYTLGGGSVDLKPADRVELKGKKSGGDGGAQMLRRQKW